MMFPKEIYLERRQKLKTEIGRGLILLPGNSESPMNYADNTYHFRQDSSFLYFFGLNYPDLTGIIDCDSGEEWIFGDDLTIDDFVWMGPQASISERSGKSGIAHTGPVSALDKVLRSAINSGRKIHFLPPYRPENKIKLLDWLGIAPSEIREASSTKLIKAVVAQRNYKSQPEIEEIEKAADLSVDMHSLAMRMAKAQVSEAKIAAAVQNLAVPAGGQTSFPIIATINGQTLHNHYHGNTLKRGQMFLLDAGAETEMGYCADLSSTVPVSGKFDSRQRDIYNIALHSHNTAIEMLKPGTAFKDVYYKASEVIFNGMKDLGLAKGNTQDALKNGAHAMFFPCGLGHMMGLDVHDMEDLGEVYVGYDGEAKSTQFGVKSLRLGRVLEPGFVLTIEPGIYFIPELIDLWRSKGHNAEYLNFDKLDSYRSFGGLRNEEDFLITDTGYKLLGKPKPKTIEDVEAEWAKGV